MATSSFKCPECGGDRITALGSNSFHCEYCGTNFSNTAEPSAQSAQPAMTRCPYCGGEIVMGAQKCRHCGEWIVRPAAAAIEQTQQAAKQPVKSPKSKGTAAVLAFLLGCLGAHKFYLGQTGLGILYLLITVFSGWLVFPFVVICFVCVFEMIYYLCMSDEEFSRKYDK